RHEVDEEVSRKAVRQPARRRELEQGQRLVRDVRHQVPRDDCRPVGIGSVCSEQAGGNVAEEEHSVQRTGRRGKGKYTAARGTLELMRVWTIGHSNVGAGVLIDGLKGS